MTVASPSETIYAAKPKHERAAAKLRRRVAAARPGEKFSEAALAREFGISRSLFRTNVTDLVHEGLLVRVAGCGTFVTDKVRQLNSLRVSFGGNIAFAGTHRTAERAMRLRFPDLRLRHVPGWKEADVRTVICHQVPMQAQRLVPLDAVWERYPDLAPDAFLPKARRLFEHEGRLIALPLLFSPAVLHYNPLRFEEAGVSLPDDTWTWEDMIEAARVLHRPDRDQVGVSMPQPVRLFLAMVWSLGGDVADAESGHWDLHHDAAYRAAALFARFRRYDTLSPSSAPSWTRGENADPRAAMVPAGGVLPTQIKARPPDCIRVAPMPLGTTRATWILAEGIGLTRECTNLDQAAAYIHELAGPTGQQAMLDAGLRIPGLTAIASRAAAITPYLEQMPYARIVHEISGSGVYAVTATQLNRLADPADAVDFCHHTEELVNALLEYRHHEYPEALG